MSSEQLVENIINNAMQMADAKSDQADRYASSAVSASGGGGASVRTEGVSQPNFGNVEPQVNIPSTASGYNGAIFNSVQTQIIGDLTSRFAQFFADYFPNECDYINKAQDWLCKVLSEGGSGIKPVVSDQIWQRDRARALREAGRASDELVSTFAARGFPLPPGALAHQLGLVQVASMNAVAESGRERAIQEMQAELENVRFAVTNALNYRIQGMQAAADYLRTLALGPQIASQLSTAASDAQAKLITAASSYFNARIRLEEIKADAVKTSAQLKLDVQRIGADVDISNKQTRVQTLAAVAQSLGQQAAAALNSIHSSASLAVHGEV